MLWLIVLFSSYIDFPQNEAISLNIDGRIDLGPEWNFEYHFVNANPEKYVFRSHKHKHEHSMDDGNIIISMEIPTTKGHKKKKKKHPKHKSTAETTPEIKILIDTDSTEVDHTKKHHHKKRTTTIVTTTTTIPKKRKKTHLFNKAIRTSDNLYAKPHIVGDDVRIKKFILHLYKRALKYFNDIKGQVHNQNRVNSMLRSYKNRFTEFINETQNMRVKTRLGTQKVMLNTLEMSNRMLRRIINYLVTNTENSKVLREGLDSVDSFLNVGLEKEIVEEYKHLCARHGICRSGYGFTDFLADMINTLLVINDKEFKRCVDSLTEAVKGFDFNIVLEKQTNKHFVKAVENIDTWTAGPRMKTRFMTLKNILVAKNQPLLITEGISKADLNRTLALLEVLNILHEAIPSNKINVSEWKDLRHSIRDYTHGYRKDIQAIMDALIDHIYKRGILKMNWKDAKRFSTNIKILVS